MTFIPDRLNTSDERALNAALWRLLARGWSHKRAVAALLIAWNEDYHSEDGLVERALDIPDEDAGKTPGADIYAAAAEAWGLSRGDAKARLCWSLYGSGPTPLKSSTEQPAPLEIGVTPSVAITGVTKNEAKMVRTRLRRAGLLSFYRVNDKSVNMFTTKEGAAKDRETLMCVLETVRAAIAQRKETRIKGFFEDP
jgi:hypothetical protein